VGGGGGAVKVRVGSFFALIYVCCPCFAPVVPLRARYFTPLSFNLRKFIGCVVGAAGADLSMFARSSLSLSSPLFPGPIFLLLIILIHAYVCVYLGLVVLLWESYVKVRVFCPPWHGSVFEHSEFICPTITHIKNRYPVDMEEEACSSPISSVQTNSSFKAMVKIRMNYIYINHHRRPAVLSSDLFVRSGTKYAQFEDSIRRRWKLFAYVKVIYFANEDDVIGEDAIAFAYYQFLTLEGAVINESWTVVPYDYGEYQVDPNVVNRIEAAFNMLREVPNTILTFRRRIANDTCPDYLDFVKSTNGRCSSSVGKLGGRQEIWITPLAPPGVIVHEILHALGFIHEHERIDADKFRRYIPDLRLNKRHNIGLCLAASALALTPFPDIESLMHYPEADLECQRGYILEIDPKFEMALRPHLPIGQREQLSRGDTLSLQQYGKPNPIGIWSFI